MPKEKDAYKAVPLPYHAMDEQSITRKRPRALRATAACEQCRRSKIRCNGQSPCEKCTVRRIECVYRDVPVDPVAGRFELLEKRIRVLEDRLNATNLSSPSRSSSSRGPELVPLPTHIPAAADSLQYGGQLVMPQNTPDVVSRGLISIDEAELDFLAFFDGCDQYVPVFDNKYDTFESVRQRSGVLFDALCAVGRRSRQGQLSPVFRRLNNELKKRVSEITLRQIPNSIEVIQALLVISCYWDKGWIITSLATRIALDMGLQQRLRDLLLAPRDSWCNDNHLREARVWLGIVNLDHIFSLDGGKDPSWQPSDEIEGRRCRALLDHPASLPIDARLIAQVELNRLRAQAYKYISQDVWADSSLVQYVHGLKLDADIWFQDWERIVSRYQMWDSATHIINFKVIQHWTEIVICCKFLQHLQIENIEAMTPLQLEIVSQAFESARNHLRQLALPPKAYIASFRYAMDFVHAKCAFSILLVLKLSTLLQRDLKTLIGEAQSLFDDLSQMQGQRNVYTKIIEVSIEKAQNALKDSISSPNNGALSAPAISQVDEGVDLTTYVPTEFIFEWDFPGLTLFSIPLDLQMFLTEFTAGI